MDRQDRGWVPSSPAWTTKLGEEATLTASYARNDVVNDDISRNTYDYTLGQGDPLRNLLQNRGLPRTGPCISKPTSSTPSGKAGTVQLSHDRWTEDGKTRPSTSVETFPAERTVVDYRTLSDERSEDYLVQVDHKDSPLVNSAGWKWACGGNHG